MRGVQRGIVVVFLALTVGAVLVGAVGAATTGDTNTTDSTPTPTPTPSDSLLSDTVDDTTDTVEETVNDTSDTVEDTVDDTTDSTDSTVDDTTDTVDSTVDDTTDSTDSTVDDTTDTVDDTADTVDSTIDSTDTADGTTLDEVTENTTGVLTSSLDEVENTSDSLTDVVDDSVSTTTSTLDSLTTLDDGSLLAADDDTLFTVSKPSADGTTRLAETEQTDETATFESYEGDDETAASLADAESGTPIAAMSAGPAGRQLPSGPGPMAVGATAVAGVGAVVAGSMLGSGTGIERRATRRITSALGRLVRMVVPFRYSSYDGSDPLEHEDRKAIHDYVAEQPGAYMSAVSEAVDVPHSTARHHIRILEREGLLENAKVRGRRRLFPAHAQQQELAAAMADEATADVLEAIARLGPCSGSALAEEVGKSISTVSHHLSRLEDDDLVVREKEGRATVNRLPSDVQAALAPEREPATADPSAISAD